MKIVLKLFVPLFCLPFLMGQMQHSPSPQIIRDAVHHLFIQGHPLGEMMRRDEKTADGKYRHFFSIKMKLIRGPHELHISSELQTLADAKHQLESYRLTKKEGDLNIFSEGIARDGKLYISTTRSGNKTQQEVLLPEGTMSALSYDLYLWLHRDALQDFETQIFHEDLGTFAHQSSKVFKKLNGYKIEHQALGMQTHELYDKEGRLQSAHTIEMDLWALAPGLPTPAPDQAPLDIMKLSSWKIKRLPQNIGAVVYEVLVPDAIQFQPYQDQNQTLLAQKENRYTFEVKNFSPTSVLLSEIEKEKLTRSTALEPHEHPALKTKALELQQGSSDQEKVIRAISNFVYKHIKNKSLDRGAASALETLHAKKGDCTEHSILASALLRSLGYPTRLVDGLIAFEDQLGYHEWLEVYVEGKGFVPLDPTFNEYPAGPNRLKFAVGESSPEGMVQLGVAATQLLSGIKVSVKSFRKAAKAKSTSARPSGPR